MDVLKEYLEFLILEISPNALLVKNLLKKNPRSAIEYLKKFGINDKPDIWLNHVNISLVQGHKHYSKLKTLAYIHRYVLDMTKRISKGDIRHTDVRTLDHIWQRWQILGDTIRRDDPQITYKLYHIRMEDLSKLHRDIETLSHLLLGNIRRQKGVTKDLIKAHSASIVKSGTLQKMSGSTELLNKRFPKNYQKTWREKFRTKIMNRDTSNPDEVRRRLATGT